MPIQSAFRPLYRAELNGTVVAESDDVVVVEGNAYFPPESLRAEYFTKTRMRSLCPWKGVARYYTVTVDGVQARNAAWTYPHPFPLARRIKDRVAFWGGVQVVTVDGQPSSRATSSGSDDTE